MIKVDINNNNFSITKTSILTWSTQQLSVNMETITVKFLHILRFTGTVPIVRNQPNIYEIHKIQLCINTCIIICTALCSMLLFTQRAPVDLLKSNPYIFLSYFRFASAMILIILTTIIFDSKIKKIKDTINQIFSITEFLQIAKNRRRLLIFYSALHVSLILISTAAHTIVKIREFKVNRPVYSFIHINTALFGFSQPELQLTLVFHLLLKLKFYAEAGQDKLSKIRGNRKLSWPYHVPHNITKNK